MLLAAATCTSRGNQDGSQQQWAPAESSPVLLASRAAALPQHSHPPELLVHVPVAAGVEHDHAAQLVAVLPEQSVVSMDHHDELGQAASALLLLQRHGLLQVHHRHVQVLDGILQPAAGAHRV